MLYTIIHPSIRRSMGSLPVGVEHAFHKLPPFDSWLCHNVCCMHVIWHHSLISSSHSLLSLPRIQSHLPCQKRLVFSALSCSFGRRVQIVQLSFHHHLVDVSLALHSSPQSTSVAILCARFACNILSRMLSACPSLVSSVSTTYSHTAKYACQF